MSRMVSVIMPAYNRARFLERSIRSCFEQSYKDVEVIVIDDGSTDETKEVVLKLQGIWGADRLRYYYQSNQGACAARNKGMDVMGGEFVQFLDPDDYLDLDKFKCQIELMEKTDSDAAVCKFVYIDLDSGKVLRVDENNQDVKERLVSFRGISTAAPLFKASMIPGDLRWNTSIVLYDERDFYFRYFLGAGRCCYVKDTCSYYGEHSDDRLTIKNDKNSVDYKNYFLSSWNYYKKHRTDIPKENQKMMYRLGVRLAVKAYMYQKYSESFYIASKCIVHAWFKSSLKAWEIAVKSFARLALQSFRHLGAVHAGK